MKKHRYYMFHKPAGCITARRDEEHPTVMDYFPEEDRFVLFPVGRLDIDTEGLLLVTDDGHFDQALIHPKSHVEKRYLFYAFGEMTEEKRLQVERGVRLRGSDKFTKPAKLKILERGTFRDYLDRIDLEGYSREHEESLIRPVFTGELTISEGRKHQVKRMMKAVGCKVVYLKRISIGPLMLDDKLKPGEYRELTEEEIQTYLDKYLVKP